MPVAMLPIILSGIGTVAGKYFQDKNEKIKQRREYLQTHVPKVNNTLTDISSKVDSLSYYADEVMFSLVFRGYDYEHNKTQHEKNPELDKRTGSAWDAYSKALREWQCIRTTQFAAATSYFGDTIADQLNEIQEDFDVLEKMIKATYYKRIKSQHFLVDEEDQPNDFRKKYFGIKNPLNKKIQLMNVDMIKSAREWSYKQKL